MLTTIILIPLSMLLARITCTAAIVNNPLLFLHLTGTFPFCFSLCESRIQAIFRFTKRVIFLSYCHCGVVILSPCCCHVVTVLLSYCHRIVIFLPWCCHVVTTSSYCHHGVVILSPCCSYIVTVLLSYCHHVAVMLSPCCHVVKVLPVFSVGVLL